MLNGICCLPLLEATATKYHAWRPNTGAGIHRISLINYTMCGNFSPWQIVSIRCLLICVLSGPGRYLNGTAPYFTNVYMVIRFNFCPPLRSSASSNYKLVQMHVIFAWFILKYASFKKQIGTGALESGI